jgi:hypothetical protein
MWGTITVCFAPQKQEFFPRLRQGRLVPEVAQCSRGTPRQRRSVPRGKLPINERTMADGRRPGNIERGGTTGAFTTLA